MVMKKKEKRIYPPRDGDEKQTDRNDKRKAPRVGSKHTNQKKRERGCLTSVKEWIPVGKRQWKTRQSKSWLASQKKKTFWKINGLP